LYRIDVAKMRYKVYIDSKVMFQNKPELHAYLNLMNVCFN